jgi:hypothetical protein
MIMAISQALEIPIRVAYVDASFVYPSPFPSVSPIKSTLLI